ncbi:MAG: N-acetylneuraminate synthase family protein [Acidobacteria bacterium]|nr:N-acetylneuraminate synthase family protein [Acidobacteriota bacterium]
MPLERPAMSIAGRRVAEDIPPFVIAEIGLNHGGSPDRALALVDAAATAGAHAVKLQTIVADQLVAPSCPAPAHVEADSLVDFFRQVELDEAAHHAVAERASMRGLKVISTPFSEAAVDMLERVGVDAYKIASGDLTWDQLIVRAASTGKPLIISTGMSTLAEAHHALAVARLAGAEHVALLHCVSAYPVPRGSENLLAIRTLSEECRVPVGLSDHGEDTFAVPIAVGLGACLYERHLVLHDEDDAIDRAVSSTPSELAAAIRAGRRAWSALGSGRKACLAAESVNVVASRRSLCALRAMPAGHVVTAEDLVALRPASGLPPSALFSLIGRRLARSIAAGEPVTTAHVDLRVAETHRVA